MQNKSITITKKICAVAMFTAIAVILGAYSLRIGVGIKISLKFIPVFLCSVFFGPIFGGLCGALSDIISYLLNSVGAFLWQYTVIEFLYGLSFGLFFKGAKGLNTKTIIRTILCVTLNTILLTTFADAYVLKDLLGRGYLETIIYRIPSTAVNMVFRFIGIFVMLKILPVIRKANIL